MEKQNKSLLTFRISIAVRIMAAGASIASSWMMLTNHENALVFGMMPMLAKYSYVPSFKLMAYANVVAGVLAVLSLCALVVVAAVSRKKMTPNGYFFLFLHDLVVMTLVMAGSSAATAEGNVGRHGNPHSGWMPICGYVGHFCSRATASIALSYSAFFLFLALTVLSAFSARNSTSSA
ncbi:hypothetical protein V2J09_016949 [Rumex salicifolius]